MPKTSKLLKKQLTATGVVTTDNKPGKLYYCKVWGDTAGDSVAIKDGATTIFTLLVPAANGSDEIDFMNANEERIPYFSTDIDCTITTSNNVYATFIYTEIG